MKRIGSFLLSLLCMLTLLTPIPASATQTTPTEPLAALQTKDYGLPYYIMVNRKMNTVTIYTVGEDGYYSVPYKAMICSTARAGHNTPLGTFKVQSSRYEWRNMLDNSYGQYATRFYGNYLFHSVCYTDNEPDKLMVEEYNMLGGPASMGCVRLQTIDAKWIYDNCAAGTKVTIYESENPGPLGKPERLVDVITPELENGWDPTDPRAENPWRAMLVSGLDLPDELPVLTVGASGTLTAELTPSTAVYPPLIQWNSSNPSVATVDQSGRYTAVGIGSATLTAACGDFSDSVTLSVGSLTLSQIDSMQTGDSATLTASLELPDTHSDTSLLWSSSDPSVVTVDKQGKLIAQGAGTASITVTCGMLSASTSVTVTGQALPFSDLELGSWYYPAARFAYEHGFLSGTGDSHFSPHNSVTQAQLAQILYSIAGTPSIPWYYPELTGVTEGAWYENAARWSYYHNIFTGRSTGCFEPYRPVTREEVITALYHCVTAFYKEEPVSSQPLDSFADACYIFPEGLPAMRWAVEHGYIAGIENKLLPQDGITRAQLAVILKSFWSDLPISET